MTRLCIDKKLSSKVDDDGKLYQNSCVMFGDDVRGGVVVEEEKGGICSSDFHV